MSNILKEEKEKEAIESCLVWEGIYIDPEREREMGGA